MDFTLEFQTIVISALGAVIAALVGLAAYFTATTQNRLTAAAAAAEWFRDLRNWSSEAIDVLTEASYFCPRDRASATADERLMMTTYRCRLTALVDRGRLLLPNSHEDAYGQSKERAYRGYRHPALDALVAARRILDGDFNLFEFPDSKVALIGAQREFVSIMQGILDPASKNRSVAKLLRDAREDRKNDPTIGGLLPDPSSVPKGAEGLIFGASLRYKASNRKYGNPPDRERAV
jgi:hypothetical protein